MKRLAQVHAVAAAILMSPAFAGSRGDLAAASAQKRPPDALHGELSYLLIDATTQRIVEARWDDREKPVPVGSLIKPFTGRPSHASS